MLHGFSCDSGVARGYIPVDLCSRACTSMLPSFCAATVLLLQAHIVSSIPNDGYDCWPSIRIGGALCEGPTVDPPPECSEEGEAVAFLDNTEVRLGAAA